MPLRKGLLCNLLKLRMILQVPLDCEFYLLSGTTVLTMELGMISRKLLIPVLIASAACAQSERPKVLGVAHMAIYVKDLDKTLQFYKGLLGYEVPFTLPKKEGGVRIAFIKVNDNQYFEIFNEKDRGEG